MRQSMWECCNRFIICGQSKTAWELSLHTRPSRSQPQLWGVFVSACVCGCVHLSVFLSPRVVIFTQPYGMTAQIINYSSPRERHSKRGSVRSPDIWELELEHWYGRLGRALHNGQLESANTQNDKINSVSFFFFLLGQTNRHKCCCLFLRVTTWSCIYFHKWIKKQHMYLKFYPGEDDWPEAELSEMDSPESQGLACLFFLIIISTVCCCL